MPNQLFNALNTLKSNPMQFLMQRGLRLPQGFNGGPEDIVNYWLNNGTMSQDQFKQLQSRVNQIMSQG